MFKGKKVEDKNINNLCEGFMEMLSNIDEILNEDNEMTTDMIVKQMIDEMIFERTIEELGNTSKKDIDKFIEIIVKEVRYENLSISFNNKELFITIDNNSAILHMQDSLFINIDKLLKCCFGNSLKKRKEEM